MIDVLHEAGFSPFSNLYEKPTLLGERHFKSAFMVALHAVKTRYLEKLIKFPDHGRNIGDRHERLRQLTAGNLFARCSENFDLSNMFLGSGRDPDDIKPAMRYDYIQQYLYDMLEVAVKCDDCDQVARLVKIGATANILHEYTFGTWRTKTPLLWAVKREGVFMVRQLIAVGADVNASSGYDHATALQVAVALKDLEFASLLIGAGANVNFSLEAHGKTAIEIATEVGIVEMVPYFLESGADVRGR
ncbi:ankyrin repeat-containing domain protein [Alternaria rosae]|uniref:ankyrin repeat-containing domain protein n=1 Tax=Alternaria rosae TaxID=1187941 RepID=UPI001E8EF130|nr:ankyrin repeat-containing domain protein [Alternaria rosae]KAH6883096.1 ankyrin repeat-containing domain protein [Alternaria rosae]